MKKLLFIAFVFIIPQFNLFAQLEITQGVSSSEHIFDSRYGNLVWNESEFVYVACDEVSSATIPISLGKDKHSAITSLNQIKEWFVSAKIKDVIVVKNNGTDVLFLKYRNNLMVISNDNASTVEKEYTRRAEVVVVAVAVGINLPGAASNSVPTISSLTIGNLSRMIKNLQKLDNPKYIAGDPMLDGAYLKKQKINAVNRHIDSLEIVLKEARGQKDEEKISTITKQIKSAKYALSYYKNNL